MFLELQFNKVINPMKLCVNAYIIGAYSKLIYKSCLLNKFEGQLVSDLILIIRIES